MRDNIKQNTANSMTRSECYESKQGEHREVLKTDILEMPFRTHFREGKCVFYDFKFTNIYSKWSAFVQVMAWHRTGGKPLTESMFTQFTDTWLIIIILVISDNVQ